jgi:hypothetical protein
LHEYKALLDLYNGSLGNTYPGKVWEELQRIARIFLQKGGTSRELPIVLPPLESGYVL